MQQIERLKQVCSREYGLKVLKEVPYDENCFFESVGAVTGADGGRFRKTIMYQKRYVISQTSAT